MSVLFLLFSSSHGFDPADPPGQLNVSGEDGDPLGVDGTQSQQSVDLPPQGLPGETLAHLTDLKQGTEMREKGAFLSRRSEDFWYLRISINARVPGRNLLFLGDTGGCAGKQIQRVTEDPRSDGFSYELLRLLQLNRRSRKRIKKLKRHLYESIGAHLVGLWDIFTKVVKYDDLGVQLLGQSRLVEPAVATVPLTASSVQHLDGGRAAVRLIRNLRHRSVQTQSEDAPLDGPNRLFVGLI
ncbi:hypothetical protein F7725_015128 [Dissostichus mawsoni]|uniref:Uncharacterized protein n=1 Tax=Dissostichus mawsoni TaxID=36200 RepID=A0A7J5YGX5_DISMA|nr:hypothetical protein F7725_015128 [Dissostichus mawsoni]